LKPKVVVVGLGYVGLPIAVAAAKCGFIVVGIDVDNLKVSQINNGISPIGDVMSSDIIDLVSKKTLRACSDYSEIKDADLILICVPTPVVDNLLPDLSQLANAARSISKYLSSKSLVILESTVAPGTTRNFLAPLLMTEGSDVESRLKLVFAPERIDPSNIIWNLKNTPKLVAGLSTSSRKEAADFYSNFVDTIVECDSVEIAETAKLLENSFRLINISLINELSKFCFKMGVDVNKVINSAATKPYGFMPFYPSVGVGGHCIPVDPLYLSSTAREIGEPMKLIELAVEVNLAMPQYYVDRAESCLMGLKGKRVLIIGVAYKPNVADVRETPAKALISGLKARGAHVQWHDDLVKIWEGEQSVSLSDTYDLAIVVTPHDYLDLTILNKVPILNPRESIK
jgi:UDP-N-acetyl-D-glucosamine dehydrogenase